MYNLKPSHPKLTIFLNDFSLGFNLCKTGKYCSEKGLFPMLMLYLANTQTHIFPSPRRRFILSRKELEYKRAVAISSGISPVSSQLQTYQDISHFNLNAKVSSTVSCVKSMNM